MFCRFCQEKLTNKILDLGFSPPSNDYLSEDQLASPEVYYPLVVMFCNNCFLVQTVDFHTNNQIFRSDYAYLSSMSDSWVKQCEDFSFSISDMLGLNSESFVVEVASNDGYLLKNFVSAGIPCLGVEPTSGPANIAIENKVPTIIEFLTLGSANKIVENYGSADLVIGNNVYAHVPNILDFTSALASLLRPEGVVTLEFPHVLKMVEEGSFDTIYHEHFSYHSLTTVSAIFQSAGLKIWRVEELQTHGGSLRIYGSRITSDRSIESNVLDLLESERIFGVGTFHSYLKLRNYATATKFELNELLYRLKCDGFSITAAGAAAKGNTLLNFLGVDSSCVDFVCDSAPSKIGKYLPGSHIPIVPYEELLVANPDYIIVLPWNIRDEIIAKCRSNLNKDVKFIVHQPTLEII
jgi:hypothetical protein